MDQLALIKKSYENILKELNLDRLELKEEQKLLPLLTRLDQYVESTYHRFGRIEGIGGKRRDYLSSLHAKLNEAISILEKAKKLNLIIQKEDRKLSEMIKREYGTDARNALRLMKGKEKLEFEHIGRLNELIHALRGLELEYFTATNPYGNDYSVAHSKDPLIDKIVKEIDKVYQHLMFILHKEYQILNEKG
jgi:hypothetical protein